MGNKYNKYVQLIGQIQADEQRGIGAPSAHDGHDESGTQKTVECLALDELGLTRYCCRRMILTHVDLITKLLNYNIYEF